MRRPEGTSSWRVDTTYARTHLLGRRADYVRPFPHAVLHRRRQYYIMISYRTICSRQWRDRLGITCRIIPDLAVSLCAAARVFVPLQQLSSWLLATDNLRPCIIFIWVTGYPEVSRLAGDLRVLGELGSFDHLQYRAIQQCLLIVASVMKIIWHRTD